MSITSTTGWSAGKSVFVDIRIRIEQGWLQWEDTQGLWQIRMNDKTNLYMGRSRQSTTELADPSTNTHTKGNQLNQNGR